MSVPLEVAREGGVLTLTLNRPDKRNALSSALVEALHGALDSADLDAEVRVVVLTGAGKDFCAGADLEELLASADAAPEANEASALRLGGLFTRMRSLPKPVIALVRGRALARRLPHRREPRLLHDVVDAVLVEHEAAGQAADEVLLGQQRFHVERRRDGCHLCHRTDGHRGRRSVAENPRSQCWPG